MKRKTKDAVWYYIFAIPAGMAIYSGIHSWGFGILVSIPIALPLAIVVDIAFLAIRAKIRGEW